MIRGIINSRNKQTVYVFFFVSISKRLDCAKYAPEISIANDVLIPLILANKEVMMSGCGNSEKYKISPITTDITIGFVRIFFALIAFLSFEIIYTPIVHCRALIITIIIAMKNAASSPIVAVTKGIPINAALENALEKAEIPSFFPKKMLLTKTEIAIAIEDNKME